MNILSARLYNQRLIGEKFLSPEDTVSYLGAVQAQDYPAAKWALGQRVKGSTDLSIEEEFNRGKILRTHVMRPTWHFVMPEDILWMLDLTSPRVKTLMGHYNRKLELTERLFDKSNSIIYKALSKHQFLTRLELKHQLLKAGIETDVQRLAHIIMWAELEGIICSGPRRGKQFTYALLEKRAPNAKKLEKSEALRKLALKYFTSHGPAQVKDFAWWSGLSMKDANEAFDSILSKLNKENLGGKDYWYYHSAKEPRTIDSTAFILSIYDEYVISYKDRSDLGEDRDVEKLIPMGNALTAVIIVSGKVAGTWKRKIKKEIVEVNLSLFKDLNKNEKKSLDDACKNYGKFLELKTEIV